MSAFEYLTVNSLTSYPFKDGRAVFEPLPLNDDVFLDILFVAVDRAIQRPYISRLQATDSELNIFFRDATDNSEIFTVSIASGYVINHFDNLSQSFYGFSHAKGHVKFIFGPGMPVFFALKQDAPYGPEHTELSPGAVVYSVPKVTSLDYESYVTIYGDTQDIASVKTYYSGETAEIEAGTNTQFQFAAPATKYIDIGRGLGKGLHDPCGTGVIEDILTINKIGPDANGNVFLKATECYTSKLLTDNDRLFLRAALPSYTNFSIPHQNPSTFDALAPAYTHHGLILENFCSPKCPPENLNSFAEYLNRVTDGASDVFKLVHFDKETRGTCTFTASKLEALDFCITSSVFDSDVPCSSGFVKYFHEGRKIKVYYGKGVYYTYTIKEVLNSNEILLFEEPYPLSGSTLSVLEFKILDLGFIDNLNYSVAAHNLRTSKYDDPYIESNYTTVDAYYINKRYGTFITSTTVVYNPGRDPLNFLAIFDVPTGNPAELIPGSIKVKKSNGDIAYGSSTGTIDCKDYAIVEAIFFIPCGGNRGITNISIRRADGAGEDFVNSPFSLAAVSVACVQTALPAKTITALQGSAFSYNFNVTGATAYTLSGDTPTWLSEDLTATANPNLFGTPTGTASAIYPLTLQATTAEGSFSQRITLKYIAKPEMLAELAGKNIDVYLPDITSRTYVTSSPLWALGASNSPSSYNSSGLPLGLSLNKNKIVGKFNIDSSITYPKTYGVSFWASNAAGAGSPVNMTITLKTGLVLPEAVSDQNYCYSFPAESDRQGETIISDSPSWLTFKSSDTLATGECGFSGVPAGTTSKQDTLLARFLYAGTYKSVYLTLPFSAKSYISYPENNSIIDLYPPDYSTAGTGREWTEASPLLTVVATNNPTDYVCTGLPAGLALTNGKITGKLTAPAGTYEVTLKALNTAGEGTSVSFTLRLNAAAVTLPQILEAGAFCYKLTNLGGAQTLQLTSGQNLPSWLTFSGNFSSTCNLSGIGAGAVTGDIEALITVGFKGGSTVRKIVIPYIAKPRILSPTPTQRVELVDENFSSLVFDNSFPFLTVQATNSPTSYAATGLPTGLSIDASTGKLIGSLTSGEWSSTVTATNQAGTATTAFTIFITSTPNILYIYEGQNFCFKMPADAEGTTHYSLTGDLPSWITFNPSIGAVCNIEALAPTQTTSQIFDGLVVRKHRAGTTSTVNQELTLSYVAKPRITFPAALTLFEIAPPDFKDTVFTSSNPLFTVSTSNGATSFTASGFPANTLRIDSLGRIIGVSGAAVISTPVKITLTATNAAGVSAPVEVFFKVRNTLNEATVTRETALCYTLVKTDNPQSFALTTPADVSWISLDTSGAGSCDLIGSIPASVEATRTFEVTVTRNYNGGSTRENIKINAVLPPIITSINSGADLATRNEYLIAPPDYATRSYTAAAPLFTIQGSNNPTNFVATGLPTGLNIDSLGRVVGGPVTAASGVYEVVIRGVNSGGQGPIAICNVRINMQPLEVETYTGVDGCFKITTKDNATKYALNGTLPNNLIFEGTPGINCNIRGSTAPSSTDIFKVYQLSSTYTGGSSRVYLNLVNRSVPVITYPTQGQTVKVAPVDYFDVLFTQSSPLLTVQATNKPTSFIATGLPAGLQITTTGKIIGQTTAPQQNYTVSLKAVNPAGDSVITTFILDLNKISPAITWASPTTIPYYQPLTTTQLNASVLPAIDGVFTYTPGIGGTLGSTGTKTLKVTFTPTDSLNYAVVQGETTIVANAGAPVITSVYTGSEISLRYVYTISPPDYGARVYTISAPLLTVQATNNPTSFVASGLPPGLVIDSLGRVTGGPISAKGTYEVSVYGINSIGSGNPALFKIDVTDEIPSVNTYGDENLCLELNTQDGATRYELQQGSALFSGLTFNTSPTAVCNVSGAPAAAVPSQEATLNIRSVYPGGYSSRYFKLNHLALPSVVFPLEGQEIKKYPANFLGVTFTESNPLFTIVATNSPEGYLFYNFPEGLYIDANGHVLGTLTTQDIGTRNVSISPLNASGEGAQVDFILDLTSTPVELAWPTPEAIEYGTPLGAQQLNATALGGVAGTVAYSFGGSPISTGDILSAGSRTLKATFTPADTTRYSQGSREVTITVNKATPQIIWSTPANITYGTPLSSAQLNASCSIQGTFSYSQIIGAVLDAGSAAITATFTPLDTNNYNTATKTVTLVVDKATPVILWSNPADINYLTPLTGIQLNAVARSGNSAQSRIVSGSYTYTQAGTTATNKVLSLGIHTINVSFIVGVSESNNFTTSPVTATATINVTAAAIPVNWTPRGSMVYGTPLNDEYLNAQVGLSGASITYTPVSGAILTAGPAILSATVSSSNTNYATTTLTRTITVTKAPRTVTITSQASGKVGTVFTLNSSYSGETAIVTYSSSNPTVLSISGSTATVLKAGQFAVITASVAATANFQSATATQTFAGEKGVSTIIITSGGAVTVGDTLNLSSSATGSTGSITYATLDSTKGVINGNSSFVALSAGTGSISAYLEADANYTSATTTKSIAIAKGTSSITSGLGNTATVNSTSPLAFTITGSSGAWTVTASPESRASINTAARTVTFLSAGNVTLSFYLSEDTNYQAASSTKTIVVS